VSAIVLGAGCSDPAKAARINRDYDRRTSSE
jgi:hypothetical protein